MVLLKLKSHIDRKGNSRRLFTKKLTTMVFIREQSRTRAMLSEFMCLDVIILIEDYLIPTISKFDYCHIPNWVKLQCGFAEYIEMEFGPQNVIEKMFIDACKKGDIGEVIALMAAGARDLKMGFTASAFSNNGKYIARMLMSLDAIGTLEQCRNSDFSNMFNCYEFADYVSHRPEIGHLLLMIPPIEYDRCIEDVFKTCVWNGSTEMIGILISKIPENQRVAALNRVLLYAIDYHTARIIDYAIGAGANAKLGLSYATSTHDQRTIAMVKSIIVASRNPKRRRTTQSSSDFI